MVRVAHQKSNKQATTANSVRGPKVAKQRKNNKVVIESESKDQEKSRAVLSFRAEPPPGYTFIPAGNPQLTSALKEFAKKGNHQILAVTTTPHASRHELSREVHRIGFHFPTEVVAQVCSYYGIRLTSGGKLVEEKDDDKLFMRVYQKGQLVLDEKVRDQVTINTEAKQIIQDLFPNIPDNDLFQIIKTAFQLGDGKVGTADEIPLVRRAQLSVVAHIRHTYTNYDKLLRAVPYSEARHRVESITLQKLIDWRGDGHDDKQAMDDTLREVVVISDEEESDEVEDGQVIENEALRVQPLNGPNRAYPNVEGRPRSPTEMQSEDEAPRGYRYLPQVVRRYPVQDSQAISVARQQSRYAVWDRVREQYRSGAIPQSTRVIERVPIDESPVSSQQVSYVTREPFYAPEPLPRRVVEPTARIVSQPSPHTYIRGADGKLYERITAYPEPMTATVPRRMYSPAPLDSSRQYNEPRPVSPRAQRPLLHRRTVSHENADSTVLPSIEVPNGVYTSPVARRNPFEDLRPTLSQQNSDTYQANHRQAPIIDLTNSAEQASKRRRLEQTAPSAYHARPSEKPQNLYDQDRSRQNYSHQYVDSAYSSQQSRPILLESPAISQRPYERPDSRTQSAIVYREEIHGHNAYSPRGTVVRHLPQTAVHESRYVQSPRGVEYIDGHPQAPSRSYAEPIRQHVQGHTADSINDRTSRIVLDDRSYDEQPLNSSVRYVRTEAQNPHGAPAQSSRLIPEHSDRHTSSVVHHIPSYRDAPPVYHQTNEMPYQQSRLAQAPQTVYRDGQVLRTTYVQN